MQHSDKSFGKFLPSNEYPTKAIHPTVSTFYHPTPRLESGFVFDRFGFFATGTDMGGKAELMNNGADLVEVVTFVQAQPLRLRPSWPRTLRHDAAQRFFDQLHVMPVGTLDNDGQRNTGRFGQQTAFDALFAPVRRVRTSFFEPARGALVMAPSIDSQDQSIPLSPSYRINPVRQRASNTPASVHSRKRRYAELQVQMPVTSKAFHWQPVRRTNRIPFIASRSGTRGLWHPKGCGLRVGSSGSICFHNLSFSRQPSSFVTSPIAGSHHGFDGSVIGRNAAY